MYHFINDNFHTDIATVPPSYKMKHFHEHNRWELMFIYSGSCTLYVGDEVYMLNSGGLANPSSNTPPNTLEPLPSVYEYNSDFPPLRISHNKW